MAIKPTNLYQHLRVSYILNMVSLLHVDVSPTLLAILREVFTKGVWPNNMTTAHATHIILTTVSPTCCHIFYFIYQCIHKLLVTYCFHFRMVSYHTIGTWNISHLNSTHNFICIWYFDIYFKPYTLKISILNLHWFVKFLYYIVCRHLPEDGTSLPETYTSRWLITFII
jgi:hypothetical protein